MDPEDCLHRDFRSPSIPKQRRRKATTKYYSYRAVHPSWVGKQYYTLHLVSSTIHTVRIKPKSLEYETSPYHIESVTEKDEPALLDKLIQNDPRWRTFHSWWLTPEVELAVAQAKTTDIESYPLVVPDFESAHSETNDWLTTNNLSNSLNIQRVPIEPPGPYPPTMPDNLHLKLRVKTWTKQDNYHNAIYFWWGADRRHHKGKRKYRERHLQKSNERDLGRNQRARTALIKRYVDGDDAWLGYPYHEWSPYSEFFYPSWHTGYNGTVWWSAGGEKDCGYEEEIFEWVDGWDEGIDMIEVLDKILQWRLSRCDYEGMAEREGDGVEDDTFSVGSDVIVLEHIVDVDADLDMMSDLAELIVEGEWDVLSDTSGLSEDVVLIE